jgi:hypothetical protein
MKWAFSTKRSTGQAVMLTAGYAERSEMEEIVFSAKNPKNRDRSIILSLATNRSVPDFP